MRGRNDGFEREREKPAKPINVQASMKVKIRERRKAYRQRDSVPVPKNIEKEYRERRVRER